MVLEMTSPKPIDDAALLDGYPGAALLADPDGSIVSANAKGEGVRALVERGLLDEFLAVVRMAGTGNFAVSEANVQGETAEIFLELTALPFGDGLVLVTCRDLSMDRNLRSALVDSRQRYKDLVEISSDFAWEVGEDRTFIFVSPKGALGYAADELVGLAPASLVLHPEQYDPLPFLTDRAMENVELWMRRVDGTVATVVMSALPLYDKSEIWRGVRGVCRDVTMDRENEEALLRARNREQMLNYIVGSMRDELNPADMLQVAAKATARALSASGCRILRRNGDADFVAAAELGDAPTLPQDFIDEVMNAEHMNVTKESAVDDFQIIAVATRYRQSVNGLLCLVRPMGADWSDDERLLIADVANQLGIATEQVANHERILKLSRTDGMTGLLNRRAFFEEELPRRLKRLARSGEAAALFYVDMDNFKRVNDVHGHQIGDDAILALRDLLEEYSRPGDVLARLGGDEFAVWMDGIPAETAAERAHVMAEGCGKHLRRFSGDDDHPLGVSVGVAIYDPLAGECLEDLLARADAAMYDVKKAGKGGFHIAEQPQTFGTAADAQAEADSRAGKDA